MRKVLHFCFPQLWIELKKINRVKYYYSNVNSVHTVSYLHQPSLEQKMAARISSLESKIKDVFSEKVQMEIQVKDLENRIVELENQKPIVFFQPPSNLSLANDAEMKPIK